MNSTSLQAATDSGTVVTAPPFSRAIRITAGACLLSAGLFNGLPQYIGPLVYGDVASWEDYLRLGATNPGAVQLEQFALIVSMFFVPLGLLGVAQVCRWKAPVLTAIGAPLVIWGMWGFHNLVSMGYLQASTAPQALGVESAVQLSDALGSDPGVLVVTILPHFLGSLVGLLLLTIACWRSRAFPRTPLLLLLAFLVWDYAVAFEMVPEGRWVAPHILLVVAWGWMGIHMIRMPHAIWRGAEATQR